MSQSFELYPSRIFLFLLLTVHLLVIFTVFMLPILLLAQVGLAAVLLCSLLYYLKRDGWFLHPVSYIAMQLEGNQITVTCRDGMASSGQISADSVVTPLLTILNISSNSTKAMQSVVIFSDSMERERFRELRVLLKWGMSGLND